MSTKAALQIQFSIRQLIIIHQENDHLVELARLHVCSVHHRKRTSKISIAVWAENLNPLVYNKDVHLLTRRIHQKQTVLVIVCTTQS